MKSMPGSWGVGRKGLHTANDKGGTGFQGEIAGTGDIPGVW